MKNLGFFKDREFLTFLALGTRALEARERADRGAGCPSLSGGEVTAGLGANVSKREEVIYLMGT